MVSSTTTNATVLSAPAPPADNEDPNAGDAAVTDWEVVGQSVQSRPIRVRTIGSGDRKVLYIGGIHGDEPEGKYATEALPQAFSDAGLGDIATLTILEDANPDGRVAVTRTNANGVDVNRNFPASNFDAGDPANGGTPLSQPESRAVVETVDRVGPDVVLVMHSWMGAEFINFDGPAREIAERFSASSGLPLKESAAFAATPGSLGSFTGRDRGVPTLTIEARRGAEPHQVWEQLQRALIEVIRG